MGENDIGTVIMDCAVKLQQDLGHGLLELSSHCERNVLNRDLGSYCVPSAFVDGKMKNNDLSRSHKEHGEKLDIAKENPPCLSASVSNVIEQGGELDAASRRQLP